MLLEGREVMVSVGRRAEARSLLKCPFGFGDIYIFRS
jgi:hypothetical protein